MCTSELLVVQGWIKNFLGNLYFIGNSVTFNKKYFVRKSSQIHNIYEKNIKKSFHSRNDQKYSFKKFYHRKYWSYDLQNKWNCSYFYQLLDNDFYFDKMNIFWNIKKKPHFLSVFWSWQVFQIRWRSRLLVCCIIYHFKQLPANKSYNNFASKNLIFLD